MTITVKQAARTIGCSKSEVYRLIKLGRLQATKSETGRVILNADDITPFVGQIINKPKSSHYRPQIGNNSEVINLLKIARSSSSLPMVKSLINATLVLLK